MTQISQHCFKQVHTKLCEKKVKLIFLKKEIKKIKPLSEPLHIVEYSGSKIGLKSTEPRDSFKAQIPIPACK